MDYAFCQGLFQSFGVQVAENEQTAGFGDAVVYRLKR